MDVVDQLYARVLFTNRSGYGPLTTRLEAKRVARLFDEIQCAASLRLHNVSTNQVESC
jgi:hypothetical protein